MSYEDQWSPGQVRLADGTSEEVKVAEFYAGTRQFDLLPRAGRQAVRQSLQAGEVVRWVDKPVEKAKFYFAIFFALICVGALVFHAPLQNQLILFAILAVTGLIIVFLCNRQQVYVITNKRVLGVSYAFTRRRDPVDFAVGAADIKTCETTARGDVVITTANGRQHQLWLLEDPQEAVRQIAGIQRSVHAV